MGYKIIRSKPISVMPNEEKDLKFKLKLENRGVIHGVLVDPDGNPVKDALVKLFQKKDCDDSLLPIGFQFTDKFGQFLFPVESEVEHIIKIFYLEKEIPNCHACDPTHIDLENEC